MSNQLQADNLFFNRQEISKQIHNEEGKLEVHSIFFTIQGEGPFAGMPAIFVRLFGCNLQCPHCDTDYTSVKKTMTVQEIVEAMKDCIPSTVLNSPIPTHSLIVITGGEPFRQNVRPLVEYMKFISPKTIIQIETNGTYSDERTLEFLTSKMATVVCSPKTPIISKEVEKRINFWKYVVQAGKTKNGKVTSMLGQNTEVFYPEKDNKNVLYIQPLDEYDSYKNRANLEEAKSLAMNYGYILTPQLHKELNLP